jgi:hypothetical protein
MRRNSLLGGLVLTINRPTSIVEIEKKLCRKLGSRYKKHARLTNKEKKNFEAVYKDFKIYGKFWRDIDGANFIFTYDCITENMASYQLHT